MAHGEALTPDRGACGGRTSRPRCGPLRSLLLAVLALAAPLDAAAAQDRLAVWRTQAARVRIVRDDWGIAHVHGRTDADAVFAMMYAQAEDDFGRIESNFLDALGRRAEAEGEGAIWSDLRQRLFVDPEALKARYAASPTWLRALMRAWADGLNFYLAVHPQTRPRVIRRFEPWMALSFSEGSIGGDVERVSLPELQAFYGGASPPVARLEPPRYEEPKGSNGIVIAPSNTKAGHALLLINPHTSFYFRSEAQVTSDRGLNAYGASTWGQFFVYQGFNPHAGWMHTTSGADTVDEFAETVSRRNGGWTYLQGAQARPLTQSRISLAYRTPDGALATRTFTVFRSRHGPIVRAAGGRWIAAALMDRPVEALSQSFLRTKARDYAAFARIADTYKANSSNNTLFADDRGAIAYLHPQFIPRRDDRFDYTRPVDGADPATDWRGDTPAAEIPHLLNPASGFIYNSNDQPWSAAGPGSLDRAAFPRYMDQAGWNPRGPHALRVLTGRRDFTLEALNAAAFDPYLPEFAILIPRLTAAYDALPASDGLRGRLREQVAALRGWDRRWGLGSTQTSLAVFWGEALWARTAAAAKAAQVSAYAYLAERAAPDDLLQALVQASDRLTQDFGAWRTPWGEINRYQRLDDAIKPHFDDAEPSLAVPFTSAQWGSLASFGARRYPGTKRYYGSSGNSFVAVVEFGPRVRAVAVTAGGESGDPGSPHFKDQAGRYASGALREVYFHPDQLARHTVRSYRPGSPDDRP